MQYSTLPLKISLSFKSQQLFLDYILPNMHWTKKICLTNKMLSLDTFRKYYSTGVGGTIWITDRAN